MSDLKVSDRCDRCNAQAFVSVKVSSGSLFFCGHHFRKHESALVSQGAEVLENKTSAINSKPMAGVGAV